MTVFQELEAKFGDKVEVTGEGTPETTGFLEVMVMSLLIMMMMMLVMMTLVMMMMMMMMMIMMFVRGALKP